MSLPNSPSPSPQPIQPLPQSQLPDLSLLSSPSINSSLPLPRIISDSSAFRRSSLAKRSRLASSRRERPTRSVSNSISRSGGGSLDDFSMENYIIDIAQLGKKEDIARHIGYEQAFQSPEREEERTSKVEDLNNDHEYEKEDILEGYGLDLGGLGEKPSSVLVEDVTYDEDGIPSDDEGPDDFTQNLETWMRGKQKWKKDKDEDIAQGHEPDPDPEQDLREVMPDDGFAEDSAFEPFATSTPAPSRNHAIIEQRPQEEAKMKPPLLSRMNTEMMQDQAAEEVFDRISALQAEVEKMRREDEARRASYQALEKEHRELQDAHEVADDAYCSEKATLQEENDRLQKTLTETTDSLRRQNKDLSQEYMGATEELRLLKNESLNVRNAEDASTQAKYEQKAQELIDTKAASAHEQATAKTEIEALSRDLQDSQDGLKDYRIQSESIIKSQRTNINGLETELATRTNEVALERKESIDRANEAASQADSISRKDQEVRSLQDEIQAIRTELDHALAQLTETRRIVETVEDENDRLVQENERQAQEITDLKSSFESKETPVLPTALSEDVRENKNGTTTHEAALAALTQEHQTAVSTFQADHDKQLQILRNALLKAGESMQKREKKTAKAHSATIHTLQSQITSLQQPQPQPQPKPTPTPTETDLRAAILALNTKLSSATITIASLRAEAESAHQQKEDALQTNAIVNAELEARFAETVEAREREWRRRVELLFRERERMGKALMVGWGREEVGAGVGGERGQGFRYKFVERG